MHGTIQGETKIGNNPHRHQLFCFWNVFITLSKWLALPILKINYYARDIIINRESGHMKQISNIDNNYRW